MKERLESEIEGSKAKLVEKDRQIKELKGQRDAIFEEMHQGSTAKKEARAMVPNIQQSAISSPSYQATPTSGLKTMNKFQ